MSWHLDDRQNMGKEWFDDQAEVTVNVIFFGIPDILSEGEVDDCGRDKLYCCDGRWNMLIYVLAVMTVAEGQTSTTRARDFTQFL